MKESKISILRVPLHRVTRLKAAKYFVDFCDGKKKYFTATPNAEIILEAQNNPQLMKYLKESDLNVADSVSLLWASMVHFMKWSIIRSILELIFLPIRKHFWNKVLPEQICGSDLFYDICNEASIKNKSIFLLGAGEGVAEKTKIIIEKMYPKLKVVGAIEGSYLEKYDIKMLENINKAKPDILFLAYGCPKQELWIYRNLKKCKTVKVAMGIGGTFDFVSGKIKRAPRIFRKLGLEWFWRFLKEPSRAKRIMRAIIVFPFVFLKEEKLKFKN